MIKLLIINGTFLSLLLASAFLHADDTAGDARSVMPVNLSTEITAGERYSPDIFLPPATMTDQTLDEETVCNVCTNPPQSENVTPGAEKKDDLHESLR